MRFVVLCLLIIFYSSDSIVELLHRKPNESLWCALSQDTLCASGFNILIMRLSEVYSIMLSSRPSENGGDTTDSVCIFGEYSGVVLSTVLQLNPDKVVRCFADVDSLSSEDQEELEHIQQWSDSNGLTLIMSDMLDVEELVSAASQMKESLCNVVHVRGGLKEKTVRSIVSRVSYMPGSTVNIVWERFERVNEDSVDSIHMVMDIAMQWLLKTSLLYDGQRMELLQGLGRVLRPHPFELFRREAAANNCSTSGRDTNSDSYHYYNASTNVFHYINMSHALSESMYELMRNSSYYKTLDLRRDSEKHTSTNRTINSSPITGTTDEVEVEDNSDVLVLVSFPFNGEPIVALHLEYLYNHVDCFLITEARWTHSGRLKPQLYIEKYSRVFEPYLDKIQFLVIDSFPPPPSDWLQLFLNTQRVSPSVYAHTNSLNEYSQVWFRERYQRDIVTDYLLKVFPSANSSSNSSSNITTATNSRRYILFVVDADEIVGLPEVTGLRNLYWEFSSPCFVDMIGYEYNFNTTLEGKQFLSFMINDRGVKQHSLSALRTTLRPIFTLAGLRGWHCTYFLSVYDIVRKIESIAHIENDKSMNKNLTLIAERIETHQKILYGGATSLITDWSSLPSEFVSFHPIVMRYQKDLWEHSHLLHARVWISVVDNVLISRAYGVRDALRRIGFEKVSVELSGSKDSNRDSGGVDVREYNRVRESGCRDFNEDGLTLQIVIVESLTDNNNDNDRLLEGLWLLPNYLLIESTVGPSDNDALAAGACGVLIVSDALGTTEAVSTVEGELRSPTEFDDNKIRESVFRCLEDNVYKFRIAK